MAEGLLKKSGDSEMTCIMYSMAPRRTLGFVDDVTFSRVGRMDSALYLPAMLSSRADARARTRSLGSDSLKMTVREEGV